MNKKSWGKWRRETERENFIYFSDYFQYYIFPEKKPEEGETEIEFI
jgi:hypothetical protein